MRKRKDIREVFGGLMKRESILGRSVREYSDRELLVAIELGGGGKFLKEAQRRGLYRVEVLSKK